MLLINKMLKLSVDSYMEEMPELSASLTVRYVNTQSIGYLTSSAKEMKIMSLTATTSSHQEHLAVIRLINVFSYIVLQDHNPLQLFLQYYSKMVKEHYQYFSTTRPEMFANKALILTLLELPVENYITPHHTSHSKLTNLVNMMISGQMVFYAKEQKKI